MNSINWKKLVFFGAAFIILFIVIFGGLHILESTVFYNEEEEESPSGSKTIEKEETQYFPRQDITTVLVMGIDEEGPVVESDSQTNEGLADVVALAIFDEKNEIINVLVFNRDSMVEMPVLENGKRVGIEYAQLALSHTYGNGLEESCENTLWTVSDLLGGVRIDYYASLNMGAIPIINDAVGGVTVTVTDDFSSVDPSITKGEFTLMGDQSLTYIRARRNLGDQLNISRMERHVEYANGFVEALRPKLDEGTSFALELLDAVNEYMVTNLSGETLAGMAERYKDYELGEIISPKGENILGEEHYEFYIDEENLEELVLEFFYAPKN